MISSSASCYSTQERQHVGILKEPTRVFQSHRGNSSSLSVNFHDQIESIPRISPAFQSLHPPDKVQDDNDDQVDAWVVHPKNIPNYAVEFMMSTSNSNDAMTIASDPGIFGKKRDTFQQDGMTTRTGMNSVNLLSVVVGGGNEIISVVVGDEIREIS